MKRLAFIRRTCLPVVERARQKFDVAYEDLQLPDDEAVAPVKRRQADAILFTSTFKFDAGFIEALPGSVKVAASTSSFLEDIAAVLEGWPPLHPAGEGIDHLNPRRRAPA